MEYQRDYTGTYVWMVAGLWLLAVVLLIKCCRQTMTAASFEALVFAVLVVGLIARKVRIG